MRGSRRFSLSRSGFYYLLFFWFIGLAIFFSAGCSAQSPSTLSPASTNAASISNLFYFIFSVAVGVFVIVEALLVYSVVRFRRKSEDEMPKQIHGNTRMEIAWTVAPAIILAVVFVLTLQTINALAEMPRDAVKVKVIGHQWWWQIEYPDLGVVTANEFHIPINQATIFSVETVDVIHSFWVPELGGKMDLIPGKKNELWFRPTKAGTFHGQCAEFCGVAHANMRLSVVVESAEQFNQWIAAQKKEPQAMTTDLAKQGEQLFLNPTSTCIACHTINGSNAKGLTGPNLTHVGSRKTFAGGTMDWNKENLAAWLRDPQAIKPGALMVIPTLTDAQISALVEYITSLK